MITRSHASLLTLVAASGCLTVDAEDELNLNESEQPVVAGDLIPAEGSGYVYFGTTSGICSGTLMTNDWVLTAKHCFTGYSLTFPPVVQMGVQKSRAAEVVFYQFDDVAMMRLSTPFAMNGSMSGFERRLYPQRSITLLPGTVLTCNGYGENVLNTANGAGTLRTAQLPVRGVNFNWWFRHYDLAVNMNSRGQYLGRGDSGGSCLYRTPSGEQVVAGVTSSLYHYVDGTFNGLVDADTFRTWYDGLRVTHNVINQANGKCLDESTVDFSSIRQRSCADVANQHWRIVARENGFFELRASDSGQCLAAVSPVSVKPCGVGNESLWILSRVGGNYYEVRSAMTNGCLDVPWGSAEEGLSLQTSPCNGGNNQHWRFDARFSRAFQTLTSADWYGGTCLDIAGASQSVGAKLQMYTCNGAGNQQFRLAQVAGDRHTASPLHAPSQCLDLPYASTADGVQLQQWTCVSGAPNQELRGHWRDGAYELRMMNSDKCISTATGGVASNYAPVVQVTCGAPNYSQRWFLY